MRRGRRTREDGTRAIVLWPLTAMILFFTLVVVLSLHVWGLRPWGGPLDYTRAGTWGSFLEGLGTLAAVVVALGAIWIEHRRTRARLQADHDREVTQVFAWVEPRLQNKERVWFLGIENRIGVPIFEWCIELVGHDARFSSSQYGPLRPARSDLLLGGVTIGGYEQIPRLRLYFRDPGERIWERNEAGYLTERAEFPAWCNSLQA